MTSELGAELQQISRDAVNEALDLSRETREKISSEIYRWLVEDARKANINRLEEHLQRMKKKLKKLSDDLVLKIDEKGLIISAIDVNSEVLITHLVRGSDWFEPHPNLAKAILQTIYE
jgi:branched-subunit amino acid aminotransferase/4-amino-4-deoxychorismate lyase